MNILQLKPI